MCVHTSLAESMNVSLQSFDYACFACPPLIATYIFVALGKEIYW